MENDQSAVKIKLCDKLNFYVIIFYYKFIVKKLMWSILNLIG